MIMLWLSELTNLLSVDLTPMRKIIERLYSVLGRPARIPENMLRSLLVMLLCGYTSITDWVSSMWSHPFYAIISGFYPFDVPGVGTFYDFINLLMLRKPKDGRGLSSRKRKPDEKSKPKHSGIIRRLADLLLGGKKLPLRFSDAFILKEIFQTVFVSEELGLIVVMALNFRLGLPLMAICQCKHKCDCIIMFAFYPPIFQRYRKFFSHHIYE